MPPNFQMFKPPPIFRTSTDAFLADLDMDFSAVLMQPSFTSPNHQRRRNFCDDVEYNIKTTIINDCDKLTRKASCR